MLASLLLAPLVVLPQATAAPHGALVLDNLTFDKVLSLPRLSLLAKFDEAFPQSPLNEGAFEELCRLASPVGGLLIGEVRVKDDGDNDNADLAARYKLLATDFPAYLLFRGADEPPTRFEEFPDPRTKRPSDWDDEEDGEWEPPMLKEPTTDTLAIWLRKNGVKVPALGIIPELDEVVKKYFKGGFKESLLAEARRIAEEQYPHDWKARVYIKTMQKIKDIGLDYVQNELNRVLRIVDTGTINAKKEEELKDKIKILKALAAA
jgi:hypothetical protein